MLFVDLDGVLADFDKRVTELFGMGPAAAIAVHKPGGFWGKLSRPNLDFYNTLEFIPGAEGFFNSLRKYKPTILTGLPLGKWAEPQKREWCARMLGEDQPVIACMAKDKQKFGKPGDVLVDDLTKNMDPWVEMGGIFIHHTTSYAKSLMEIQKAMK